MQFDIGLGFMGLMLKENDQLHNLPDSGNGSIPTILIASLGLLFLWTSNGIPTSF